ncbi:hypothetical protein VOI54_03065 [Tamlana sp. 2201CG12-4]|uniref:hypothetical protein n=1 Tax=Tamlana sp. 2201CG12-4 TaxID=3112582 RepID=UPI002DB5D2A0|nr:hypothetical protein [Tamlana sp. 2201CG12-4]MEC3905991.1 hypothetical protein [Tamlana sp. 2201CG12-4]
MKIEEQYIRYPNGVSERMLSGRLGLYWEESMQDWEFTVSDSRRLSDFLKIYQTELDNDDDKFTLMGLIVSSFDDGISEADIEMKELWEVCRTILEKECFLHFSIIKYWSLLEEKDTENVFSITLYMREIWDKVEVNFL